ncbi:MULTISPECIES: hypothetical protein [Legionella]|uniref:XRE family transcriptional regulator n=2 Tax=Legionella TaxID=445 RepID=D3HTF6_LEGLN|nr:MULTISPECIES: hypothetical protein [Legionella]AUH72856.1 hypothetical protein CAB17_13020 [Legionella sainthelensi]CBJ12198.1 hypothetical protein LLO_1821 [Legionella longbeachae NSW150]
MDNNVKVSIYKGIIQYLLDSTNYTLKSIALMSNASIKQIKLIYSHGQIPANLEEFELHLVKLYQIILELNLDKSKKANTQLSDWK